MSTSREAQLPWFEDKITKTIPRNKSKKSQPLVLKYDIFLTCAEVIEDEYWKKIFMDAAYNKLPKNLIIRDGYLTHKHHKNNNGVNISQNTTDLVTNVIDFMKKTCNMQSTRDLDRKKRLKDDIISKLRPFEELTWKELNNKNKKIVIMDYVRRVSSERKYTAEKSKRLNQLIICSIASKQIDVKCIDYSNGKINNIDNIDYDSIRLINKPPTKRSKTIKYQETKFNINKNPETYHINLLKYWQELFKSKKTSNTSEIEDSNTLENESYTSTTVF